MMIRTGKKVQKCEGGSVLRSTEKLSDGSPPQGPAAWAEACGRQAGADKKKAEEMKAIYCKAAGGGVRGCK